jgi:hypothetical protein
MDRAASPRVPPHDHQQTNSRGTRIGFRSLLSAALTLGWRIERASPEEQALLDAHGFGSRRIQ